VLVAVALLPVRKSSEMINALRSRVEGQYINCHRTVQAHRSSCFSTVRDPAVMKRTNASWVPFFALSVSKKHFESLKRPPHWISYMGANTDLGEVPRDTRLSSLTGLRRRAAFSLPKQSADAIGIFEPVSCHNETSKRSRGKALRSRVRGNVYMWTETART